MTTRCRYGARVPRAPRSAAPNATAAWLDEWRTSPATRRLSPATSVPEHLRERQTASALLEHEHHASRARAEPNRRRTRAHDPLTPHKAGPPGRRLGSPPGSNIASGGGPCRVGGARVNSGRPPDPSALRRDRGRCPVGPAPCGWGVRGRRRRGGNGPRRLPPAGSPCPRTDRRRRASPAPRCHCTVTAGPCRSPSTTRPTPGPGPPGSGQ